MKTTPVRQPKFDAFKALALDKTAQKQLKGGQGSNIITEDVTF